MAGRIAARKRREAWKGSSLTQQLCCTVMNSLTLKTVISLIECDNPLSDSHDCELIALHE